MKKNRVIAGLLLIMLLVPGFQSCKKGENDPFFSFRSRKARVIGDWTCYLQTSLITTKINNPITNQELETYTSKIELDDVSRKETITYLGTDSVNVIDATVLQYDISFDKNGYMNGVFEYRIQEHFFDPEDDAGGDTLVTTNVHEKFEGTWNFLDKIDDYKKRERIAFVYTDKTITTTITTSITYTGESELTPPAPTTYRTVYKNEYANGEYSQIFHISNLRNKLMVLEQDIANFGLNEIGNYQSNNGTMEMTLEQRDDVVAQPK